MEASVTIITYRDVFQYEAEKKSRYSEDYKKLSAQIVLDKQDMANLGIKDGQSVLVKSDEGSVVVAAKTSDDDPHPALAFMIRSPWSNQLVKSEVCEPGTPGFKGIPAKVSSSGEKITDILELFQKIKA